MEKTVIIGGSGFVGTRLIDLLGKENCINIDKAISSRHNEITRIFDIRNKNLETILPDNTDSVILLAAEHHDDVLPISLYYEVNVEGAKNVLEALEKKGINKIVFVSSAAVYGLGKPNPAETYLLEPSSHYGKSKVSAEKLLQDWRQKSPQNRSLTIIRPAVIFGEDNKGNVHNLLRQIASGKFIMIGNGLNKKSMAYVGNATAFIRYCLNTNTTGERIFNYVDNPDLNMKELVSEVEKSIEKRLLPIRLPYWIGLMGGLAFDILSSVTGKNYPIKMIRIKKFCATTQFNAAKAHASGFIAPFTLSEGLHLTLKNEFPEHFRRDVD